MAPRRLTVALDRRIPHLPIGGAAAVRVAAHRPIVHLLTEVAAVAIAVVAVVVRVTVAEAVEVAADRRVAVTEGDGRKAVGSRQEKPTLADDGYVYVDPGK